MSEGSQWEAIQLAAHYGLDNLIGIIDVNRLGQRGETMYGHDLEAYEKRISAFDWETMTIDGHSFPEILDAYEKAMTVFGKPTMIIAKTVKGKGVSLLEDQNGWHGKAVKKEDLERALKEVGEINDSIRGKISRPQDLKPEAPASVKSELLLSYGLVEDAFFIVPAVQGQQNPSITGFDLDFEHLQPSPNPDKPEKLPQRPKGTKKNCLQESSFVTGGLVANMFCHKMQKNYYRRTKYMIQKISQIQTNMPQSSAEYVGSCIWSGKRQYYVFALRRVYVFDEPYPLLSFR